jgi:hypothetical protein
MYIKQRYGFKLFFPFCSGVSGLGQLQKNKARGSQNDPRALLRANYSSANRFTLFALRE